MTHLPECEYGKTIKYDNGSADVCDVCICLALRACEQRVRDEQDNTYDKAFAHGYNAAQIKAQGQAEHAWQRGYDTALREPRS